MGTSRQSYLDRLVQARTAGTRLGREALDGGPRDLNEAYAISDALASRLGVTAGWKIGATSSRGQAILSLAEPFWGAILAKDILSSPATLNPLGAPFEVECEVVFRLARDVGEDVSPASVAEFVADTFVGLEVNRPSFEQPFEVGALNLVADKGVNRALVVGPPIPGWRDKDLGDFGFRLQVGERMIEGDAKTSGFEPLAALAWLAQARRARATPLRAGDYVATGAIGRSTLLHDGETAFVEAGGHRLHLTVGPGTQTRFNYPMSGVGDANSAPTAGFQVRGLE